MPNYGTNWPKRQGPAAPSRPVQYRQPAPTQQRGPMFRGYGGRVFEAQSRVPTRPSTAAALSGNLVNLWNSFVGGARQVRSNIIDNMDVTRPYRGTYGQTRIVPGQLNGPRTPKIPIPKFQGTNPYAQPMGGPAPSRNVIPDTYAGQVNSWNERGLGNAQTVMNQTLLPDTYFAMKDRRREQVLSPLDNPTVAGIGPDQSGGGYGDYGYGGYGGGGGGGGGGYPAADRVGQWVNNMMMWNINRPTEG